MTAADMTLDKCADLCAAAATSQQPSAYFGVEYGTECYCGSTLGGSSAAAAECDMKCGGDATQICGGHSRLTLYSAT